MFAFFDALRQFSAAFVGYEGGGANKREENKNLFAFVEVEETKAGGGGHRRRRKARYWLLFWVRLWLVREVAATRSKEKQDVGCFSH